MRRRINIPADGSELEDVTDRPYRYDHEAGGALGALYDDQLWDAYLAARAAFRALESAVIGRLCGEPYDEIEKQAAIEAADLMDRRLDDSNERVRKMGELSERLLARAVEAYGEGEFPR